MNMQLSTLLWVGLGGFVGSICRFLLGGAVHHMLKSSAFPYGTMVVNLLGCFAIGVGGGLVEQRQLFAPEVRLFLLVGLLGGFTTFSTFGYESVSLAREGELLAFLANVTIQVVAGMFLVWFGYGLTKSL
jgi:CrcB protein